MQPDMVDVLSPMVEAGILRMDEVGPASVAVAKAQEGRAVTPKESALVEKVAKGTQEKKAAWLAIPAAAVLLYLFL